MNEDIQGDVQLVMQHIYRDTTGTRDDEPEEEVIHVHHFPDAKVIELPDGTVIFKKNEDTTTHIPIVESEPQNAPANQKPMTIAYLTISLYLFLILSCLMFQISLLLNPFTATITILEKERQVTIHGTVQLGRVLSPITISQSATANTTGRAHQDARQAQGTLTFYNGLFTQQFIAQGTVYTGQDGVAIVTTQAATIPPGDPNAGYGTVTVTAQAQEPGAKGNIPAGDINITINNGLLVRNSLFHGGQDERDYRTVNTSDITNAATPLKATLAESVEGAERGQLKSNESLVTPSCTTITNSDHRAGEEAATVKVTVSETCSAVAYNSQQLERSVTQLLTTQATKKLGAGYSILGEPQVHITQASAQNTKVILSYQSQSTWIYALSSAEQNHIKKLIAGRTKEQAIELLSSLPGIERVALQSSGFGDDTRIPKNLSTIHLLIFYGV